MADTDGIRVNISDKESASQDREPLPAGKFHFKITNMEIAFVKELNAQGNSNKNAGKPYINFEFTVQDGKYATRKDWTNAMCFEGALYTISQILKALGHPVPMGADGKPKSGELVIPDKPHFYIGKDVWGRRGTSDKDRNPDGTLRVQLRGFSKYEGGASETTTTAGKQPAAAGSSVLP
jgi:hypothetical protein